jgi:CMP-N-acetylneuraminic acid synthetase
MAKIWGISLIGWVGKCISQVKEIDARVISTDSEDYLKEGRKYGLDAPFLRPSELSTDVAGALETVTHALTEAERFHDREFDIVLILEPTSPCRIPRDIVRTLELLASSRSDSVVTISKVDTKFHPRKVLRVVDNHLLFFSPDGHEVIFRQSLEPVYFRNGVCYGLTRDCILKKKRIFTENTRALIIERNVVNIDTAIDLVLAQLVIEHDRFLYEPFIKGEA